MKNKRIVWLATVIIGLTFAVWLTGCGNSGNKGIDFTPTPIAPPSTGTPPLNDGLPPGTNDPTNVEIGINLVTTPRCPEIGSICSAIVTPGVPPGAFKVSGTLENMQCWDAFNPACWYDRSSDVSAGNFHRTYPAMIETPYFLVYSLANQRRVDGITINGTSLNTLNSFGVIGTDPYQWVVACFILHRDQAGTVTVGPNPNCTAVVRQARLVYSGDVGGSGAVGSYTNGVYNPGSYDDPEVPYDGVKEVPIMLQAGYWEVPNPGTPPTWQTWVYSGAGIYTETFFSVASTQATYFTIFHNCRGPLATGFCPGAGAYYETMPLGGGATACTTQLWNYNDMDAGGLFWPGIYITGFNPATGCAIQGPDTRGTAGL